jgi:hypothetical protein
MILVKNKYAYFNIKNLLRYINSKQKIQIKDFLLENMQPMGKKEMEKYMNFLNSITSN